MLDQFMLSIIVATVFLWLPGAFVLAAFRFDKLTMLSVSPVISLAIYWVVAEIYKRAGIFTDWLVILSPSVLVPVLAFVFARFVIYKSPGKGHLAIGRISGINSKTPKSYLSFAIYVAFGIAVTSILYIGNLSSVQDFISEYDNIHHLGVIRSFVEGGVWSSFGVGATAGMDESILALESTPFYPTAWHTVAAFMVSLLHVSVTLAANATNFTFAAIVFPSAMFFFLRSLFKDDRAAFLSGALFSFAFIAFPWKYIVWGPLFPNLASYSLLPAVCAMFMYLFTSGIPRKDRIIAGIVVAIELVTLAVTQTNAVFTMAVLFIPFCIWQASRIPLWKNGSSATTGSRMACAAIATAIIGGLWLVLYKAPFLSFIVSNNWAAFTSTPQAILNVLTLSFRETQPQYLLGAIVLTGVVSTFIQKRLRWVTVAYLFMACAYILSASAEGTLKHVMGGFWYTDPQRLGATTAFFAMPLACLGFQTILGLLARLVERIHPGKDMAATHAKAENIASTASEQTLLADHPVTSAIFAFVTFALIFIPFGNMLKIDGYTHAFADISNVFSSWYAPIDARDESGNILVENQSDTMPRLYGLDEQRFVDKAKEIAGDDLVINMPNDGSAYAYGINGLNVFYRYASGYAGDSDSQESQAVRDHLDEYATNEAVQDALEAIDAKYVLKLDQGDQHVRNNVYLWSYDENDWIGIDEINDDTPGFETVLSEGDMRLYKIM